ncbi:MAG: hypothetical protein IPF87_14135, partial [Gemmatimonadetes bacterium]|nr:hypothetical protein [Gemmatimonadota bacterium]
PIDASSASLAVDVSVEAGSGDERPELRRVVVRVRAPAARTIQLEGDLTGWSPVSLTPLGGGVFSGSFVSPAAMVRLRLRIDAGAWITPPGVPTQRDDFGDQVAVYLLPA